MPSHREGSCLQQKSLHRHTAVLDVLNHRHCANFLPVWLTCLSCWTAQCADASTAMHAPGSNACSILLLLSPGLHAFLQVPTFLNIQCSGHSAQSLGALVKSFRAMCLLASRCGLASASVLHIRGKPVVRKQCCMPAIQGPMPLHVYIAGSKAAHCSAYNSASQR